MPNPYADEFVDCVLKRNETDRAIGFQGMILGLILAPLAAIGAVFYLHYEVDSDLGFDDFVGLEIMLIALYAFFVFRMMDSMNQHRMRDRVWTWALIGYASYSGHDVADLEDMVSGRGDDRMGAITRATKVVAVIVAILVVLIAFLIVYFVVNPVYDAPLIIIPMALGIYFELGFVGVYTYAMISDHDYVQHMFVDRFNEIMEGDLGRMESMGPGLKRMKLWPHIALMVVTLGIYSIIFAFWSTRCVKIHMNQQWVYEEDLLARIMEREGAVGVEYDDADRNKGIRRYINSF